MRRRSYAAAVFTAVCMLLCGCHGNDVPDKYRIYSDGTYIEVDNEYTGHTKKNSSDADFYVPEGMVTDYLSKNFLTDEEKELYNQILWDIGTLKKRVELTVGSDVYARILELIRHEQLAYTQVADRTLDFNADNQTFEIVYTYRFTADEISSMNIASEKAAKDIISQLTPDMDDYEKLKFLHDYIVLNCSTSTADPYSDTIYGTLVRKKARCEGYAKAFSYLCNLAGIENVIVTGYTGVAHMWNMVKLGGNWYHVDVTWDNPDDKLHEEYPDIVLYQYFMVTDSVIENNHVIYDYPVEPPKANGRTENYFVREGTDVNSADEFLAVSENAIMSAVSRDEKSAMVKFDTNDLFISVTSDLMDQSQNKIFDPIMSRVRSAYGKDITLSWTDYYGQYRILTYIIDYKAEAG